MYISQLGRRSLKCSPIALVAVLALSGSAAAATTNDIEGVWSFNGGAVAVQALADGTFQGTVVTPTTFASCEHPAGQVMWTDMRPQADGSFFGLHQWYTGPDCEYDPVLGRTVWRVLEKSGGARSLKVCFNRPRGETQPKIAGDGKETDVTFGCTESTPLAPLPTVSGERSSQGAASSDAIAFGTTVGLPSAKACVNQTSLKITVSDPKYDPLKELVVKINGKKVAHVTGVKRLRKGVTLNRLPKSGTYKISVVAVTVLNQRLSGSRTYRSCTKGSGKVKLHPGKAHNA